MISVNRKFWQDYRSRCIVTIDPVAQRLVNPCLPAATAGPEMVDHILRHLIVVDTLEFSLNGRPRRTAVLENFSDQPSLDRSGAVSGSKSCAIELSFPFIGFPQTDNPVCIASGRPDENDHSTIKKTNGNATFLAIVASIVLDS